MMVNSLPQMMSESSLQMHMYKYIYKMLLLNGHLCHTVLLYCVHCTCTGGSRVRYGLLRVWITLLLNKNAGYS